MCGRKFKVLLQHLEQSHGLAKEASEKMSRKKRLVVKGAKQHIKLMKCPYPDCGNPVVRVDLHLKSMHKINGEELEKYKKIAKALRQKKKKNKRKETEKVFLYTYVLK